MFEEERSSSEQNPQDVLAKKSEYPSMNKNINQKANKLLTLLRKVDPQNIKDILQLKQLLDGLVETQELAYNDFFKEKLDEGMFKVLQKINEKFKPLFSLYKNENVTDKNKFIADFEDLQSLFISFKEGMKGKFEDKESLFMNLEAGIAEMSIKIFNLKSEQADRETEKENEKEQIKEEQKRKKFLYDDIYKNKIRDLTDPQTINDWNQFMDVVLALNQMADFVKVPILQRIMNVLENYHPKGNDISKPLDEQRKNIINALSQILERPQDFILEDSYNTMSPETDPISLDMKKRDGRFVFVDTKTPEQNGLNSSIIVGENPIKVSQPRGEGNTNNIIEYRKGKIVLLPISEFKKIIQSRRTES